MPQAFMQIIRLLAALLLALFAHAAFALTPFVIEDIRVEGLQRVEAGTVFASLPVRVGRQLFRRQGVQFHPVFVCAGPI